MVRPTVVHTMADWGIPSERFVRDHVRTTTSTRAVVVCGHRHDAEPAPHVPMYAVQPVARRFPERVRRRTTRALIATIALRRRARLLHAHFGYWAAHTGAVAERLRLPWVVSLHGYDVLVMADREPEPARLHGADLVIVPSRFLAGAAAGRGFPADRIRVIPSGIDVDAYTFRARTPRPDGQVQVTFAGRFVAKKGVLDAARAMASARDSARGLTFTFAGFGPLEGELRAELDRLRLPARVVDGRAPGAFAAVFDETDLLLTTSRTAPDGDAESLGLVNLEAQLSGIPIVTTAHGGIPEAVAPDGAVLVPEGDIPAIAAALVNLAERPQDWPAMGLAGSEHVRRNFRLADRVREVEEHYLRLIELRAGQRRRNRP